MEMNQGTRDIIKNVSIPMGIYLCITVISFLVFPSSDFTRTLIFLTGIFAVFHYKNEFEEILLICFGSPALTGIVTIPLSIYFYSGTETDLTTLLMSEFVMMATYIMLAGIFGLTVNIIASWLSGFLTARTVPPDSSSKKNIFTALNNYSEKEGSISIRNDYNSGNDSLFVYTDIQVFGILSTLVILSVLSATLLILPLYDYSFDLHLTVWDIGLIPTILIGLAVFSLISLVGIVSLWRFFPKKIEKFPSSIVDIQAKFCVLGIFFASAFFPTPSSMQVDSFAVQASIGIEILTYVIGLLMIVTPAIIEFFRPLPSRNVEKILHV